MMPNKPILLIAEDDPDDQFLIEDAIKMACTPELEMHFVWDGVELMNFLRTRVYYRPNLIVLDLNMPGKDGRTALKEIKADPNLSNIPVVVLTTSQSEADLRYCQKYGVAGYHHKPGSMAGLKEIFHGLCTNYLNWVLPSGQSFL